MKRAWKNIGLYFIVAQPVILVCFWIIIEGDRSIPDAIGQLGYVAAGYVIIWVAAIWTALAIPVAFLIDRFTRSRLSREQRRAAIIVGCGVTGYLLAFQLTPLAVAGMLGCAIYGAVFSMSDGRASPPNPS